MPDDREVAQDGAAATESAAEAAAAETAAEEAAAVALDDPELTALQGRYVDLCKAMAEALEGVGSEDRQARVAAVQKHGELDGQVGALVDELNAACG